MNIRLMTSLTTGAMMGLWATSAQAQSFCDLVPASAVATALSIVSFVVTTPGVKGAPKAAKLSLGELIVLKPVEALKDPPN